MKVIDFAAAALLPLLLIAARAEIREVEAPEARLIQACETLLKMPLSAPDLQMLANVSRDASANPEIRKRSMSAYALSLLLQGNTNSFMRAVKIQHSTFPDGQQPLIRVTENDYIAACGDCEGKGIKPATCPYCLGSGKCRTCKGTGQVQSSAGASVKCTACVTPGVCRMCAGRKILDKPCPACNGTGRVFKLGARVRENYNELLSDIIYKCRKNAEFAAMFNAAANERDPNLRISMLHSLTNRFQHRDEVAEALGLLDTAMASQAHQAAIRQERETRERHEREIIALRKFETAENIPNAISTLKTYLQDNPDTHAKLEIQLLIENLEARLARHRLTRRILTGLAILFSLLMLVMFIQPLLRRKPVSGTGTLPGMDKLKSDDFTDPLKLTAQESRDRAKSQTARIPFSK